jgi:proteasome alpha subunit
MFPGAQGYDRAITVFSPDGRLYQVEYAMETVRRGSLALGIKHKEGTVLAVDEKLSKLQTPGVTQKIFQVDDHIGVAAAGYIPDARIQVDQARVIAQSNRLIYDQPVDLETLARKLADASQQYTQFAGVRPFGVSLIICGVDRSGSHLWKTDPSGNYVAYNATAIGAGSEQVIELFEKKYDEKISFEDAILLAIESIISINEEDDLLSSIKISIVDTETQTLRYLNSEEIKKYYDKLNVSKAN